MNEEKLLYFKGLLVERLNALLDGAGKTVSGMSNDYKEELLDPTDRASPSVFVTEREGSFKSSTRPWRGSKTAPLAFVICAARISRRSGLWRGQ